MAVQKSTVTKTSSTKTESRPNHKSLAPNIPIIPILVVLLVVAAFALGYLINRVQYFQDKVQQAAVPVAPVQAEHPLTKDNLVKYAKALSMDTNKFSQCLTDGKYKKAVQDDTAQGVKLGVNGTPAFFINGHLIVGAQPIQVFTDAIDLLLAGGDLSSPTGAAKYLGDDDPANGEVGDIKQDVEIGNAPMKGNKDAKVTMIEFSDFECPFCSRFFTQSLGTIMQKYVDTGKMNIVYKQFPLTSIHSHAAMTAEASLCASDQGKFWEYHDKLFTTMSTASQ